jgi:hypothetical protein
LVIHWRGGIHTELCLPRRRRVQCSRAPAELGAAVRQLARVCSDKQIGGSSIATAYAPGAAIAGRRCGLRRFGTSMTSPVSIEHCSSLSLDSYLAPASQRGECLPLLSMCCNLQPLRRRRPL